MDDNSILQHFVDVPDSKVLEFKALLQVKRPSVEGMLHRVKLPIRAGIFDQGDSHYDRQAPSFCGRPGPSYQGRWAISYGLCL